MISWDDKLYLGSIQHIGNGTVDRDTSYGTYVLRFVDNANKTLREVGIPVNWNSSDIFEQPRPVTFFALNVEYPLSARQLQIINRMSGKVLGTKDISEHKPTVKLKLRSKSTIKRSDSVELVIKGHDPDHDKLQYFTMARAGRDDGWFPITFWQSEKKTSFSSTSLPPGQYFIKVRASDGVHVSDSNEVEFNVTE
jgi:hypothetical protein